ncbi:formate dehydrogenase subunit gamma [Desulfitobacterium sp. Sab5]|uniref:formate dehydrogenase subunit gamma n=1 Tax=Desulfitobacterium nosdiversum TaxID=3375356 RepID=UPI003CF4ACA9
MGKRVQRFNKTERYAHWANAFFFGLLFFSGMLLFFGGIASAVGPNGVAFSKLVHRIAAIPFILIVPVAMLLGTPQTTKLWVKDVLTWSKDDRIWLSRFAQEFFGKHIDLPPQGRLNAGEKINTLLGVVGCGLLCISGLIMWQSSYFAPSLILVAYAVHDLAAATVGAAIIGHSYLGVFQPGYKDALEGMMSGTVSETFAKGHHAKWYAQECEK